MCSAWNELSESRDGFGITECVSVARHEKAEKQQRTWVSPHCVLLMAMLCSEDVRGS